MPGTALAEADQLLAQDMGMFYSDPLGFVRYAFRWNEGDLRGFPGPVPWQAAYLEQIGIEVRKRNFDRVNAVAPIRMAVASGHGVGKGAITAWLILWILSTRPHSRGVVTANTAPQLETKTWSELAKWKNRVINRDWWELRTGRGSLKIFHKEHPDTWRVDGLTCREENSESFAGLHEATSTPFYIFDEASAVPTKIWEVAEGGLTDGEPMMFVFGNPTRNTGRFRECFGRLRHRWLTAQIDSRRVPLTNKTLLDEWIKDYGEDSDFCRVRIKGMFPRASEMQFIPTDVVFEAMQRKSEHLPGEPLILGIDIARGGEDRNVLFWRSGRCARPSVPVPEPIVIPGEQTRDSMKLVSRIVQALEDTKPDVVFLDGSGIGGPIADRLKQLRFAVIEVQFGAKPPDEKWKCANMRAYMWARMRQWLIDGGSIMDSPDLEADLTAPEYHHNVRDELVLESKELMKKRGLASPDLGDALALTFAAPVGPKFGRRRSLQRRTAIL